MIALSLTSSNLDFTESLVDASTLTFLDDAEYEFVGGGGAPVNSL